MLERILAFLFPPRLPGRVTDWDARTEIKLDFSSTGPVTLKQYRNGIDRYFTEEGKAS